MKAVFFSSLRVRLIFLVLLAMVPALGVICYTAQKQRRLTSVEAQQSGLRLARLVSASQSELVDGTRQLLVALTQIPVVRNTDPVACNPLLKGLLAQYTRYANFGVANAEGDLFCSGLPLEGRVNAADRAWFQRAVQTRDFAIGDYQIGRVTRKATINFGYPIFEPTGEVKAVAFAALDLAWLNKLAAETHLPPGATLTVIDRNGTILARYPDSLKWVGKSMPEGSLLSYIRAQHNEGTADTAGLDGTPRLYGFASLGGGSQGGAVIVGLRRDLAFAAADRILIHTIGWLVLILTMAVAGAWMGGNWLVLGQIHRLIRATKQLEGGDLGARVGLSHNKGELDQLGAAFDQMAGALQARDTEARQLYEQSKQQAVELERINKDLKRREEIEERLRELNQDITRLDIDGLLKKVTEKVREVLRVDVSDVRILKGGQWSVMGLSGVDSVLIRSIREGTSNRRSRWIIENRKPLAVPDTGVEKSFPTGGTMRRLGLRGYLGVPLLSRSGEAVGVLRALTYPPRDFSQDEVDLLQQMANSVAIAVENAQLFEEISASKMELERANQDLRRGEEIQKLLKELSQDITSLDIDSLLKKLTQKVREVCKMDVADVRILTDNSWQEMGVSGIEPERFRSARSTGAARGRSSWIIENRRPLVIRDITQRRDLPSGTMLSDTGIRGYVGAPLLSKDGEVFGILRGLTYRPRDFTPEEVDLLQQLANGAAIALENARLLTQTQQQATRNSQLLEQVSHKTEQLEEVNHQLAALCSVATVVNQNLDMNLTLSNGMHKVLEIFELDAARIYIFDQETKELRLATHEGFTENTVPRDNYQPGEGFVGRVFENGEPLFFKDIQDDSEFQRLAQKKVMLKAGYRAQFYIPIRVKGRTVGVINFAGKRPREFLPSERELIHSIADHIGIAVENATLFSEIREKTIELEKADKVKNEFLGFVSHELKTPVNAIKGYVAMIRDKMLGQINSQQEDALNKVMGSSNDLVAMINSLLVATKIEAGAITVETQEIDLCDLLEDLKSTYAAPLNKELSLVWDYPSDLPAAKSDADKLKHVLRNLIDNAIKYTDKGTVMVSARYSPISAAVEFKVWDTGIGIPNEALPSIFEMFCQVNGSEKRSGGGVGLGLHIVKKFTELLGGKIELETQVGKGSTFTVTIPMTSGEGGNGKLTQEKERGFVGYSLTGSRPST